MTKTHLEEVNGTVMVAVPAAILERLNLSVGSEVEVDARDEKIVLGTVTRRGRYNLDDLLAESDPAAFEQTDEDRVFLNSAPVGRELI
jgi:antitoxin ChpS